MNATLIRTYVAVTAGASIASVATLPTDGLAGAASMVVGLIALCAAAGTRAVRLPGTGLTVTASDLFVFAALAGPAPLAAPVVAAAGTLAAEIQSNRKRSAMRFIFNLAVVPLSAAMASWTVVLASRSFPQPTARLVAVVIAAVIYLAVNLIVVAGVVALEGRNRFLATIAGAGPWTLVSVVASAVAGLGLHGLMTGVGSPAAVLGLVAVPPMVAFSRLHAHDGGREVSGS